MDYRGLPLVVLFFCCLWKSSSCVVLNESRSAGLVGYTPYESDVKYLSNNGSRRYDDARGMYPLYTLTDLFVNFVGSHLKKDIPNDLLPSSDGNIGNSYDYTKEWLKWEQGVTICAGIGVALAILVPLIGLIFCCCRCCGHCGAAPEKYGKRSDPCHCGTLTALLVLLCIVMTFGLVAAFLANHYMRVNVRKVNETLHDSIGDIESYLQDSQKHASHVLVYNFKELEKHVRSSLNDTEHASEKLFDSGVDLVEADKLFAFADRLGRADVGIKALNASFLRLQELEDIARQNVSTIRSWIQEVVDACNNGPMDNASCRAIASAQQELALAVDFADLSLSQGLAELEKQISPNAVAQIREARTKLGSVRANLSHELEAATGIVKKKLDEARIKVLDIELKIRQHSNQAQHELAQIQIQPYFDYVYQYNDYVWYGKLALCILLALFLSIFVLGSLFGICGRRSGAVYVDPFCSKRKGACLLMCGVGLVVLFFFFAMMAVVALFIVGVNLQLLGCDSVINPTANNHIKVLSVILRQYNVIPSEEEVPQMGYIPQIIQKCYNNESIYNVLGLNTTFSVESVMDDKLREMDVLPEVERIVQAAAQRIKQTSFLSARERAALLNLANNPLINRVNLEPLRKKLATDEVLRGSMDLLMNGTNFLLTFLQNFQNPAVQAIAHRVGRELDHLRLTVVPEIEIEKARSLGIVNDLSTLLEDSNASSVISAFVSDLERVESRFHQNSEPIIREIANDTLENVERLVNQYINYSLHEIQDKVGRCGPASAAINSTVGVVCDAVLHPFNGYWLSSGFSLIVFLPILLISVTLAWHYRLPESYGSGSSDSSDYETHTEIDTIPLANRRKRIHPSNVDNSGYDSRARQSKATQWAFHNAFKDQAAYHPVHHRGSGMPSAPPGDDIYTRPPSYYYPGSNS